MSSRVIPEPWLSFLREMDGFLREETHFHCLGGFVVTMFYGSTRTTADVDVILFVPRPGYVSLIELAGVGSPLHKKYGVYLDSVTIAAVPIDYDSRLTEMFAGSFKNLRLLALDPYDIALSKIERNIERDREDILYLAKAIPFDLDILKQRYTEELRPDLAIPEREDLTLKLWIEMIEEQREQPAR